MCISSCKGEISLVQVISSNFPAKHGQKFAESASLRRYPDKAVRNRPSLKGLCDSFSHNRTRSELSFDSWIFAVQVDVTLHQINFHC